MNILVEKCNMIYESFYQLKGMIFEHVFGLILTHFCFLRKSLIPLTFFKGKIIFHDGKNIEYCILRYYMSAIKEIKICMI